MKQSIILEAHEVHALQTGQRLELTLNGGNVVLLEAEVHKAPHKRNNNNLKWSDARKQRVRTTKYRCKKCHKMFIGLWRLGGHVATKHKEK